MTPKERKELMIQVTKVQMKIDSTVWSLDELFSMIRDEKTLTKPKRKCKL